MAKKRKKASSSSSRTKRSLNYKYLDGKINARGFQDAIGIREGQGLKISEIDQSFLEQLLILEEELAAAKTKYRPDSITVKNPVTFL